MRKLLAFLLVMSLAVLPVSPLEVFAVSTSVVDEHTPAWTQEPKSSTEDPLITSDETSGLEDIDFDSENATDLIANELYLDMVELLYDQGYGNSEIHIDVTYYSREYLEELTFNSQENIFYGYKLSELDELFDGTRYVFSCDDSGITTAKEFEAYDETYDRALRNVAVGTGIIIICVTVTLATGGFGAPVVAGSAASAVNIIFSSAATGSAISALSGGAISAVITGATVAAQTNDWEETKKAVALAGSEGFMWGAVFGAGTGMISGAIQYGQALKAAKALPRTALDDILKNTPVDGNTGHWVDGTRGNGKFIPDDPVVQRLLAEKGLDGITYSNGIPDFSAFATEKIEITGKYLDSLINPNSAQVRQAMQKEAKELLASQRGISVSEVNNWMKELGLTIHEDINMTTLSFVPTEINRAFNHLGGVSEYIARLAQAL